MHTDDSPIEIETTSSPSHSVIWLHGLGADGNDFASAVPALNFPARFVLPHAPVRAITINGGMTMRGWFDIAEMDFARAVDVAGIAESCDALDGLVEQENRREVATENIFLAGFSQGGVIALHTGIRAPHKFAGIIALSTYLPTIPDMPATHNDTPIFFAHGSHDPLIPIDLARRSAQQLEQLGFAVAWHEYAMEHNVCAEEVAAVGDFLRANRAAE